MTPAIIVCETCGDAFWADRAHDCEYHLGCGGVWDQHDRCNKCGTALATGARSAETNEDLAQSEGRQSGPKGNAQEGAA